MVGFLMVYLVVPRVARLLDLSSAMSFEIYQADFQLTRPINYWKRCFYTTYSNGRDDKPTSLGEEDWHKNMRMEAKNCNFSLY